MQADDHRTPIVDNGPSRLISDNWTDRGNVDTATQPSLDPSLFSLLLGRIEHLSRELGRAETQRLLVEQHITRLEQQIEKLTRQQEHAN